MRDAGPTVGGADTVLIVDDEEGGHNLARPHFEKLWRLRHAWNIPQARAAIEEIAAGGEPLVAAIVDFDLVGGTGGLDVAATIGARFPGALVVLFTAHLIPRLINDALVIGAHYIYKDDCFAALAGVARRVLAGEGAPDAAQARVVGAMANELGLTPMEGQVLVLACKGLDREEIGARLGLKLGTVKIHIGSLLEKARQAGRHPVNLRDVVRRAHERAGTMRR